MKAVFFAPFLALAAFGAAAGEIPAQRFDELKMDCDTCHGVRGVSVVPDQVPSIAGRSEGFLVSQLKAFRTEKRRHDTMALMGDTMSDAEIRAIARYYSRVKR
ncbi:c-type cytochrome [Methylocystis sp. JAN1]|uniref:c-type cytochrome n=1 Tax=Methylocystis sp. JAN1 TaxID=3397211 RepID=UPI003FA208D5